MTNRARLHVKLKEFRSAAFHDNHFTKFEEEQE